MATSRNKKKLEEITYIYNSRNQKKNKQSPTFVEGREEQKQSRNRVRRQQKRSVKPSKGNKTQIKKWNYINIKRFCTAREIINEMKMQPTEWEKIFVNHISDKRLISKIGKNLYNSIGKNITQSN